MLTVCEISGATLVLGSEAGANITAKRLTSHSRSRNKRRYAACTCRRIPCISKARETCPSEISCEQVADRLESEGRSEGSRQAKAVVLPTSRAKALGFLRMEQPQKAALQAGDTKIKAQLFFSDSCPGHNFRLSLVQNAPVSLTQVLKTL